MAVQAFFFLEREGLDQSRLVQDGNMAPILLQIVPTPHFSQISRHLRVCPPFSVNTCGCVSELGSQKYGLLRKLSGG